MSVTLRLPHCFRSLFCREGRLFACLALGAGLAQAQDGGAAPADEVASRGERVVKPGEAPAQWSAAFQPVLWDDNYKLGLGFSTGLRLPLGAALEAGAEGLYTRYRPRMAEFMPVNEWGLRVFAVRALDLNTPFTLKLGVFVGAHHFAGTQHASDPEETLLQVSAGGEAHAVFAFASPWGLDVQFSPGYGFGEGAKPIYRLGLGTTYNLGGALGKPRAEKRKAREGEHRDPLAAPRLGGAEQAGDGDAPVEGSVSPTQEDAVLKDLTK